MRAESQMSVALTCRVLISLLLTALTALAADRPNVLFIAIDDLRPSLGCYGDPIAITPNIDRLSAQARQFNRAYCMQSVCGPSRTAILTGRLPDNTGVWHNRNRFRERHPNLVTLPQLFKNNGYHTLGLGKIFSGNRKELDPQSWSVPEVLYLEGWNNYVLPRNGRNRTKGTAFEKADVPDEGYTDGKLAKLAVETLEKISRSEQPFFLAVGFFKPHLPFNAPKSYWDLYDPAVFEPNFSDERTHGAPDFAYPDHLEMGGYTDVPEDERVSAEQARELRHGYYACVSYADAQVGKLLRALERLGLEDDTIVVLWGDHGYSLGEAGHWCKDTNFELDTHVPLMVRTPRMAKPGVATEALTEYVDIYPTLAELAGLTPPDGLDGRSFASALRNPSAKGRDLVLSQFSRPFKPSAPEIMGYSIRTATQRYTRWIDWMSRRVLAEELYDYADRASALAKGSFLVEQRNLIDSDDYMAARDQLRSTMDQTLRDRIRPKRGAAR